MSFISSVASSSLFATTIANTTTSSLRPFANLDLTEQQRTQIRAIFQQAKTQGLSQTQIQQQINAVLTPAQQTTLQNDISQFQSQNSAATGTSSSTQTPPNPSSTDDPLDNLTLTTTQQSQIDQVLQEAQAGTITQSEALAQITNLLTPAQQTLLQQDEQTARTQVSGRRSSGGDSTSTLNASLSSSSVATLPNGVSETDIQNQVAAATSVILNQLQAEVGLLG